MTDKKSTEAILITKPIAPDKEQLFKLWSDVIDSGWFTNMGSQHNLFESELKSYLSVNNISVLNNGTLALIVALKALDLPFGSEVITTPFTFAATAHAIAWNGLKPVFADIELETMTLCPKAIKKAITSSTSAILPVHVYGFPCDVEAIQKIAKEHNLKVLYDGAHSFSTKINEKPICEWGDITMLSFHATKLFNSIEGGALVYQDQDIGESINELRNFGIKKLTDTDLIQEGIKTSNYIDSIGINGKMNEFQASWGRINLQNVKQEQERRQKIAAVYQKEISKLPGVRIPQMPNGVSNSWQYYPILFDASISGVNRDDVYNSLLDNNIYARKYFYPLCSEFGCYKDLPSAMKKNLPISHEIANNILCLPFYGDLLLEDGVKKVCSVIKNACSRE